MSFFQKGCDSWQNAELPEEEELDDTGGEGEREREIDRSKTKHSFTSAFSKP